MFKHSFSYHFYPKETLHPKANLYSYITMFWLFIGNLSSFIVIFYFYSDTIDAYNRMLFLVLVKQASKSKNTFFIALQWFVAFDRILLHNIFTIVNAVWIITNIVDELLVEENQFLTSKAIQVCTHFNTFSRFFITNSVEA